MLSRFSECLRRNVIFFYYQNKNSCIGILHSYRTISSSEIATALRPVYFVVHPDLFGRHPEQRSTNEESLKLLTAHLETIQQHRMTNLVPKLLKFYVRDDNKKRDSFKLIKIELEKSEDPKRIIQKILKSFNLSTDFIDKVKSMPKLSNFGANAPNFDEFVQKYQYSEEREKTLKTWLKNNVTVARERDRGLSDLKEDVEKLQESLTKNLELKEIRYECGWNYEHFRGCLKTLERLSKFHDCKNLKDRVVVFASFTGISLEGHVMLFTGDVLNNWQDFLKKIPEQLLYLKMIPKYEQSLSQVLLSIKIRRRKFMPKQQVVEYAGYLNKLTTTLLDYLTTKKYPKSWDNDLSSYEIVVESEAGPLMVSPTGQFIAPSTCPGFMLVDFIKTHLDEAKIKAEQYNRNKHVERDLHSKCIRKLNLKSLQKDDSVTPERMIKSLERLLEVSTNLDNINLNITNYYSVLTDGTVCIPWDFAE